MKKIKSISLILSIIMLLISFQGFSQEMSRQDYLDKSRRQKTAAFTLLGGGIVLGTVGATILFTEGVGSVANCIGLVSCEEPNTGFATGMMVVGGLATIGSIPLFISASNNKKRAFELSFKPQPTNIPKYAGNIPRSVPSITYTISLK